MKQKYNGIYLIGQFCPVESGAWLFVDGDQCALFEAPEYDPGEIPPVIPAKKVIEENNLKLKYVLISHPHRDHVYSIREYRKAFPDAMFVAHKLASFILHETCSAQLLTQPEIWRSLPDSDDIFNHLYEDSVILPLGNKTIHQVHAPKHSPGDAITYFNHVLFTGDWWLLEGDPGNCMEVLKVANHSINRVHDYITENRLDIRHIFPSHANNMMYNVDIEEILHRTLVPPGWWNRAMKCPVKIDLKGR